jgi:7-cyano-7-deazaguanine synthase
VIKAVTLLSGGQDSTTCAFWARKYLGECHALTFRYGQRHAGEIDDAIRIAAGLGMPHTLLDLSGVLAALGDSALLAGVDAPLTADGGRPDAAMPQGLPSSFVPGRNLLFFSAAAALAVKLGAKAIVTGVCQTDYSGYPDCRKEFVDAFERAATLAMPSSAGPLVMYAPLMQLSKSQTVQLARTLPGCWEALATTTTCYLGRRPGCGACAACVLRAKGFAGAGERDPAQT